MILLLLTVWLAAKEHCRLEAAGWLPDVCAANCATEAAENADGCDSVESAQYKHTLEHVTVPPPALLLCLGALAPPLDEPPPVLAPELGVEPERLVRTWQFVERAAPPSRAPSVMV